MTEITVQPRLTKWTPYLAELAPNPLVVLSHERRILYANPATRALAPGFTVEGMLLGEVLSCVHAGEPAGCGETPSCMFCGANKVIRAGIRGTSARAECRLTSVTLRGKERAEFSVYSVPIECEGEPAVFCALNDVSSEKRRAVLERAFFHDILNTAASVKGLSDLIALDRERIDGRELSKFLQMMRDSCETLVDEILSHQVLLSAETGQLHTSWGEAAIADCLREAVMVASHLPVASLKPIQPEYPPATAVFRTDRVLLGRVLLNLLKNALEATPDGQAIHVGARVTGDEVEFTVQNPAVLSQSVRLQIFQRSFTTKGAGRGIGTYAAKLLTEQYLGGEIEFRSSESEGTVFTVRLPLAARS